MAEVGLAEYIAAKKKKNPKLRMGSLKEIAESQKYPPLTSGNLVLDYVTSIGGVPRGVVTEMRGFNSSGKTTAAAMTAAQHQQAVYRGEATGAILYLDFEYAVSETYFRALGLDVEDSETFVYYQPDTLEEGFQTFLEMTKAGYLAMGVVDSIAGASAEAEYENEIGKLSIGQKAKAINQALRMCVGPMKTTGTGLILINHTQDKIPQTFMERQAASRGIKDTVSPGGKGIEYYSSIRLEFAKPRQNKTETMNELTNEKTKQVTSTEVEVTAFKNKVGVPHRSGKMRVHFGRGFSQAYSAFHILLDHGLLKKKTGGHFVFPDQLLSPSGEKLPVGEDNVIAAIEADPEWQAKLVDVARKLVINEQVDQKDEEVVLTEITADGEIVDPETGEVLSE